MIAGFLIKLFFTIFLFNVALGNGEFYVKTKKKSPD
jgi:hypothetical protein